MAKKIIAQEAMGDKVDPYNARFSVKHLGKTGYSPEVIKAAAEDLKRAHITQIEFTDQRTDQTLNQVN